MIFPETSVSNRDRSILRVSHKSISRRLLALSFVMPARQEKIIQLILLKPH